MFLRAHTRRPRHSARLHALVLALVLTWLARPEKALAQYDYSGLYLASGLVISTTVSVPVLITDLAILAKLSQGKPVGLGWSITGIGTSLVLMLVGGGGLAGSLDPKLAPSALPIGFGVSLAFGGVSLAIASVGLYNQQRTDRRGPAKTSSPLPPESKVEVELSGTWQENEVVLRGTVVSSQPMLGVRIHLRVQFIGQAEEWIDARLDAHGRFQAQLVAPAERQHFKAVALFRDHLRRSPALSEQVQLSRPSPTAPAAGGPEDGEASR